MVKAAREGRPMEEATAAPAKPRLPARPPVPKAARPAEDASRRGFLAAAIIALATPYYLAWSVMVLIGGVWSLLVARFMMPNMIVEPPMRFKVGPPSDYPAGTVSEKWKAERGIWIVNTDSYDGRNLIYALASVCTHLGCTPNWLDGEQKYKCPCHGSGFYINGINFEGPAPRPLERVGIRLAEDGSLEVDKSVKYQEELGQWQDPNSYVELV
jgi:cytochrome b6-f complex iron-sulfur subunit